MRIRFFVVFLFVTLLADCAKRRTDVAPAVSGEAERSEPSPSLQPVLLATVQGLKDPHRYEVRLEIQGRHLLPDGHLSLLRASFPPEVRTLASLPPDTLSFTDS